MKRAREESDETLDDIGVFLADGTYALVFASSQNSNDTIYRVEAIEDKEAVMRHVNAHIRLSDNRSTIGPCVPTLIGYDIVTPGCFPKRARELINKRIIEWDLKPSETELCLTAMEKGNMGSLNDFSFRTGQMRFEFMFMLMWTCWVANTEFGFRQRDIKAENIVVKHLTQPRTMTFSVKGGNSYKITTNWIPMMVDFGFTSFDDTDPEYRYMIGTFTTAPPEFMAHALLFTGYEINVNHNGLFYEDVYDFWSITITILIRSLGLRSIMEICPKIVDRNAKTLIGCSTNSRLSDEDCQKYAAFFRVCFLQQGIGNHMFPGEKLLGRYYSPFFFTRRLYKQLVKFDEKHGISRDIRASMTEAFPERQQRKIFQTLLSWDPRQRICQGKIDQVLEMLLKPSDETTKGEFHAKPIQLKEFQ